MPYCPQCGTEISGGRFCPQRGVSSLSGERPREEVDDAIIPTFKGSYARFWTRNARGRVDLFALVDLLRRVFLASRDFTRQPRRRRAHNLRRSDARFYDLRDFYVCALRLFVRAAPARRRSFGLVLAARAPAVCRGDLRSDRRTLAV